MSFRELQIRSCYESSDGDIIEDFYIPVLSNAIQYDRIAGFFSSSALAVAARGIGSFIGNGGRMRLLCSPNLSREDIQILEKTANINETHIDLDVLQIESEFVSNHVKALGWMLQQGMLEIRLVIPVDTDEHLSDGETIKEKGLFHQKVGILIDSNGDGISFSGSINETATAWVENDEEFKVFRQWEENQYFESDYNRFISIWDGKRKNTKLYSIPDAIKEKLMRYSHDFDPDAVSLKKYLSTKSKSFSFKRSSIPLFSYQAEALDKWKNNNCQMMFEMATGTGKTRTAIAGMNWLFETHKRLIAIIACPQDTLARQWKNNEVDPLGVKADISIIADSTNPRWEDEFRNILLRNSCGLANHCIVYTTHATLSGERFISVVEEDGGHCEFLLIGDEAHWLGAGKLRNGLLKCFSYRIGLSATPSRWFDDRGTEILKQYFGNCNYEFTIHDALTEFNPITKKHFLVKYKYDIRIVSLNDNETLQYKKYTKQLVKLSNLKNADPDLQEKYNRILERRADIIRNAEGKYEILKTIIREYLQDGGLSNMIVFVSPQQINRVSMILNTMGVIAHRLTEAEGTTPESRFGGISEREHIIKEFKAGTYQVLIAIKCLDEGIDIPIADRGVLMASSTNPREYVQRIGRIIRQAPGKTIANIHDICVGTISMLDGDERELEINLRNKELTRLREISENASNSGAALKTILDLKNK